MKLAGKYCLILSDGGEGSRGAFKTRAVIITLKVCTVPGVLLSQNFSWLILKHI